MTRSRVVEPRRSGQNGGERISGAGGPLWSSKGEKEKEGEWRGEVQRARPGPKSAKAVRWREEKAGEEARWSGGASAWRARARCVALAPLKEKALASGARQSERGEVFGFPDFAKRTESI